MWPNEIVYTGASEVSGPVAFGDERDVSDREAQKLIESGFWELVEEKTEVPDDDPEAVAEEEGGASQYQSLQ